MRYFVGLLLLGTMSAGALPGRTDAAETKEQSASKVKGPGSPAAPQQYRLVRPFLNAIDYLETPDARFWPKPPAMLDVVPCEPMRPETVRILRGAVIAGTKPDGALRKSNLDALDRLAKISWPRLAALKRVRVELHEPRGSIEPVGWLIKQDGQTVYWLSESFRVQEALLGKDDEEAFGVKRIDNADFKTDIQAFLLLLSQREKIEHSRDWDREHGIDTWQGRLQILLFHLTYAAADCGLEPEANTLFARFLKECPDGLAGLQDVFVWKYFDEGMNDLKVWGWIAQVVPREADWRHFLRLCNDLQTAYPQSAYAPRLKSLSDALEKELAKPPPAFLDKPKAQLTEEETIQYLIYRLRDLAAVQHSEPGAPDVYRDGSPASCLVAIGAPAIPYLIDALADETPTRTSEHSRFIHDSESLLRRQDIAYGCLVRITGCAFYYRYRVFPLNQDTPARRGSAIEHAKDWWKLSQGASQAAMLRNYLKTLENNKALNDPEWDRVYKACRIDALVTLAHLEGPEEVLDELRKIPQERSFNRPTSVEQFDPPPSSPADHEWEKLTSVIAGHDAAKRREAVRTLGAVHSWKIQRALLNALNDEPLAEQRLAILSVLKTHPMLWHLPGLTKVLVEDNSVECRVAAGRNVARLLSEKTQGGWWNRLQTRDDVLAAARRIAATPDSHLKDRQAAVEILVGWDSFIDKPQIERLQSQPALRHRGILLWFKDILGDSHSGQDLVGDLTRMLHDTNAQTRQRAAQALSLMGKDAGPASHDLIKALPDQAEYVRRDAIAALQAIGAPAPSSLAQLKEMLTDEKRATASRDAAVSVLAKVARQESADGAVPYLIGVVRFSDEKRRAWAIELLEAYGTYAKPALPVLQERAKVENEATKRQLRQAIRAIEKGG